MVVESLVMFAVSVTAVASVTFSEVTAFEDTEELTEVIFIFRLDNTFVFLLLFFSYCTIQMQFPIKCTYITIFPEKNWL